ncbi:hypothetical protein [Kushneria sp. EE4]
MKIYEVPDGRRYWVVRAEGGRYYDHFVKNDLMALGHLNDLGVAVEDCEIFAPEEGWLKDKVSKKCKEKKSSKRTESASFNQIKNFIFAIKEDDWVITVGEGSLSVGIVIGEAYIENKGLVVYYDVEKDKKVEMGSSLRRRVKWGPRISRSMVPFGLSSSLRANQTVFNIDKHWEAIYHSLYPAFIKDDDLYLSLKIRQEKGIDNYSVVQILSFLNEIEVIAKEIDGKLVDHEFEAVFREYANNGLLTLTTKAQFYSPGDVWNKFPSLRRVKMRYLLVGYAMLFGNDQIGMDGVLDLETRHRLWDIFLERIEEKDIKQVVSNLELSKPVYDTSMLEYKDKRQEL